MVKHINTINIHIIASIQHGRKVFLENLSCLSRISVAWIIFHIGCNTQIQAQQTVVNRTNHTIELAFASIKNRVDPTTPGLDAPPLDNKPGIITNGWHELKSGDSMRIPELTFKHPSGSEFKVPTTHILALSLIDNKYMMWIPYTKDPLSQAHIFPTGGRNPFDISLAIDRNFWKETTGQSRHNYISNLLPNKQAQNDQRPFLTAYKYQEQGTPLGTYTIRGEQIIVGDVLRKILTDVKY